MAAKKQPAPKQQKKQPSSQRAEVGGPHFLGAFAPTEAAPLAFVATKSYNKRERRTKPMASEWVIDVLGTRKRWRGCGVATALAEYCLAMAEAALEEEEAEEEKEESSAASPEVGPPSSSSSSRRIGFDYSIDVVPTAVSFWKTRFGFIEVEASGEQQYYMTKGGDRPMTLRLPRRTKR